MMKNTAIEVEREFRRDLKALLDQHLAQYEVIDGQVHIYIQAQEQTEETDFSIGSWGHAGCV